MKLSQKSLNLPSGRAVLLSIKPIYSDLILSGKKRIEFRRVWAVNDVDLIAIYASSPIQKIVGLVDVKKVVSASPATLFRFCELHGGGITKVKLNDYLVGKKMAYGIFLGAVRELTKPIGLGAIFENCRPPQSFRYLTEKEVKKLVRLLPENKQ